MKKEMQRILIFSFLSMLMLAFFSTIVFAQSPAAQATEITKGILTGAGEFLSPLFSPQNQWLTKLFFAMLLGLIIYDIVPLIIGKNKNKLAFLISLIITILAMIAIPANFIDAILTQYGAMGAALLSAIPFVIILIASIRVQSALVARVIWLFYAIYYFALYLYKIVVNYTNYGLGLGSVENISHFAGIIAGIFMFFFIVKLRALVFKGQLGEIKEEGVKIAKRGALLHELQKEELEESYGGSKTSTT